MPTDVQLSFAQNINQIGPGPVVISNGTMSFIGWNLRASISFLTLNMGISQATAATQTISVGLYSLNGVSLSLANSISTATSLSNSSGYYASFTSASATQNITPGTWYWGLLVSTSGNSGISFYGNQSSNIAANNAFPGAFIGGIMTESTAALPTNIATSDLDITGSDATGVPYILLSA